MNRIGRGMRAILLLTVMGSGLLSAQEQTIGTITITGPKRTREAVIRRIILPAEEGAPFTDETEEMIIQKLRATGIFNPEIEVTTENKGDATDIRIMVRDRWTLIPVPIFSTSKDGSWRAGALVIEGNVLGLNKTLGLGFFYGSDGWSLLNFFSSPQFLNTDLTFVSGISAGLDETTDLDEEEDTLREYKADTLGFNLGLEFPLREHLSATGSWEYDRSFLRSESKKETDITDMEFTGATAELKWKDVFYDIPYERGLLAKAAYSWNWGLRDTDSFPVGEAKLTASFTPWYRHLVKLEAEGGWGDLPVQKEFRLGGVPGTFILPQIPADRYGASSLSYNMPVFSFSGGTVSGRTFYEAGVFESDSLDATFFHGPGVGLELFINNLAIPAVGLNLGWNLETGRYQFSAGIGMGGGSPD